MTNRWFDNWGDLLAAKTHTEGTCIIWDAGCHLQGYPMVRWDGKMQMVKRVMMERKLDIELTKQQRVKNSCGNLKCINAEHHYIAEPGTEEWKCVGHQYTDEQRSLVRKIFNEYKHPSTGSKNGAYAEVRKTFPSMTNTTALKILNEKT